MCVNTSFLPSDKLVQNNMEVKSRKDQTTAGRKPKTAASTAQSPLACGVTATIYVCIRLFLAYSVHIAIVKVIGGGCFGFGEN